MEDETILKAIAFGAKGYVSSAASPTDFVRAIRVVSQGSVWAPRRVLSVFIDRVSQSSGRFFPADRTAFTTREKETARMAQMSRCGTIVVSPRFESTVIPVVRNHGARAAIRNGTSWVESCELATSRVSDPRVWGKRCERFLSCQLPVLASAPTLLVSQRRTDQYE
jgi:hypothetical protein